MKKIFKYQVTLYSVTLFLLLAACQNQPTPTVEAINTLTEQQPSSIVTQTPTSSANNELTYTETPTAAPLPTQIGQSLPRDKIRQILYDYGQVDEKYLTDEYWNRLNRNIEQYGKAQRITVFEYHGDNYWMYDGGYSMTPESFTADMHWLMKNNYHFVTGAEMYAFLNGWLDLPKRSIFLTTDSSAGSDKSMARIIDLYKVLESQYGYPPHMNSYIWTMNMEEHESARCKQDACWQTFRNARDSGYFTIGTHTESHGDFSEFTPEQTYHDLHQSMSEIEDHLGIKVFAITWPLEACSPHHNILSDLGIKYAFGGWTRELLKLYSYQNDNLLFCLPRVFPPNPDGISGRPNGLTLQEILMRGEEDNPIK